MNQMPRTIISASELQDRIGRNAEMPVEIKGACKKLLSEVQRWANTNPEGAKSYGHHFTILVDSIDTYYAEARISSVSSALNYIDRQLERISDEEGLGGIEAIVESLKGLRACLEASKASQRNDGVIGF